MLVAGGVDQELPNEATHDCATKYGFPNRPYVSKQWKAGEVPGMKLVGNGMDGLDKSQPGDIITDGQHVGIISGPSLTISASSAESKIVENDWGWRYGTRGDMTIFRYDYYENSNDKELVINPQSTSQPKTHSKNEKLKWWLIGGGIGLMVVITAIVVVILIKKKKDIYENNFQKDKSKLKENLNKDDTNEEATRNEIVQV